MVESFRCLSVWTPSSLATLEHLWYSAGSQRWICLSTKGNCARFSDIECQVNSMARLTSEVSCYLRSVVMNSCDSSLVCSWVLQFYIIYLDHGVQCQIICVFIAVTWWVEIIYERITKQRFQNSALWNTNSDSSWCWCLTPELDSLFPLRQKAL